MFKKELFKNVAWSFPYGFLVASDVAWGAQHLRAYWKISEIRSDFEICWNWNDSRLLIKHLTTKEVFQIIGIDHRNQLL